MIGSMWSFHSQHLSNIALPFSSQCRQQISQACFIAISASVAARTNKSATSPRIVAQCSAPLDRDRTSNVDGAVRIAGGAQGLRYHVCAGCGGGMFLRYHVCSRRLRTKWRNCSSHRSDLQGHPRSAGPSVIHDKKEEYASTHQKPCLPRVLAMSGTT